MKENYILLNGELSQVLPIYGLYFGKRSVTFVQLSPGDADICWEVKYKQNETQQRDNEVTVKHLAILCRC